MIFSVLPDLDRVLLFTYPLVRNGIAHSFFAATVASFIVYLVTAKKSAGKAAFLGYISHLLIDLACISKLNIFFPHPGFYSIGIFSETGTMGNFLVLSFSVMLLAGSMRDFRPRVVSRFS